MRRTVTALLLCLLLCAVAVTTVACTACSMGGDNNEGSDNMMSDLESGVSSTVSNVESGLDSMFGYDENESSYDNSMENSIDSSDETLSSEETAPTGAVPDISDFDLSGLDSLENEKKGWGQGLNVDELNRPISCDIFQEDYGKYGTYFIMPSDEKTMYLTFDEGYENGYTAKILDTLKEKNCKAVFFVTGDYAERNRELVQRMIDEGHIVGNHSQNHKSMPTLSTEDAANEILELHNYMLENFNYKMTLFRPPMGEWSTRTLEIANRLGYKSIMWSFAYKDYDVNAQPGYDAAYKRVSEAAHPGAIYLLHAVSSDNADILGTVIDEFRAEGYSLELLT